MNKENRTERLQMRITPLLKQRIIKHIEQSELELTISQWIRSLILKALRK
jgi:hypothetical protein